MTASEITDLAREGVYRFLAAAFRDPSFPAASLLHDPLSQQAVSQAAELLASEAPEDLQLGFGELPPRALALGPLLGHLEHGPAALAEEFRRVFGLVHSRECPLYETEYHPNQEPFFRSQQMADVAGFYQAFGLEPAHRTPERPDYLPLELEFMAFLLMKKRLATTPEDREVCAGAEAAFLKDHLVWWLPGFSMGLRHKAARGFYLDLALILAAWVPGERARFGLAPAPTPRSLPTIEAGEESVECGGCAT